MGHAETKGHAVVCGDIGGQTGSLAIDCTRAQQEQYSAISVFGAEPKMCTSLLSKTKSVLVNSAIPQLARVASEDRLPGIIRSTTSVSLTAASSR
jgi:hypothetical protein